MDPSQLVQSSVQSTLSQAVDALRQMGFQVEFRGNTLVLRYPRRLVEAEISRQIKAMLSPQLWSKVRVRCEGDVVVEVELL